MKKTISPIVILTLFIALSFVLAGCGRSPIYDECTGGEMGPAGGYCFVLDGTENYPDFLFYYLGNVLDVTEIEIGEINRVYKLNTHITIYAVPKELVKRNHVEEDGVASQEISLKLGKNVLKITSFDKENKKMQLEVIE
ncbi:hypothetical protein KKA94_03270 [Patescibacteria group bacterium]|nr:hypothetical protein [Patescibacteria group bacterium]